jgi:hypothetical protein
MTYHEIADLLGCTPEQARIQTMHRGLDRKKSRDGFTRVKLDSDWTGYFFTQIRAADPSLNQAIDNLQAVHAEMARDSSLSTGLDSTNGLAQFAGKSRS